MQKFLLAFLMILCGLFSKESFSQTSAVNDTLAIKQMLGDLKLLKDSDLNSALQLSKVIQKKAAEANYPKGIWDAQIYEGQALSDLGQPDSAISILTKVIKETQKFKFRLEEIRAHQNLANALQQNYNFQPAIDHLIQAQKLLKNTDPFDIRFYVLNLLAITHRKMKDYTSALKYFDELENNFFFQMDTMQRFLLFQNKGNVYAVMGDYAKTEEYFKKAYDEIIQINSPAKLALITYNLGALYFKQERYQESEEYVRKALKSYIKIGDQIRLEMCYRVLGAINNKQGRYLEAIKYLERALKIAKKTHNPRAQLANYKGLYGNYWSMGYNNKNIDYMDKALTYYLKFSDVNDSVYKSSTAAKILELEKKYETEKKNNQITLLEKENQHHEDQLVVQRTHQTYLVLVIILVSGILGIFIYFFYYYKKVNKTLQLQGKRILAQKEKISEQNNKLQKSINTQTKLFSIIAHDLRSPLASMSNIAKLIGYYIEDKNYNSLEETARMMDQKNDQVLDLTDNLLNWAKSQSESLEPLYEPISLKEIIEECFDIYQPIAKHKNIALNYLEEEDLKLWADRNMVRTICRNLINNAIKFTPKGGTINISHTNTENKWARVCVQDSGIGISEEKLGKLFEMDREKVLQGTEGEKSSGLGLSVCKEFIDVMEGKIHVDSDPGKGSQFCFELTLYNPEVHHPKYKQSLKTSFPPPMAN